LATCSVLNLPTCAEVRLDVLVLVLSSTVLPVAYHPVAVVLALLIVVVMALMLGIGSLNKHRQQ